jgi:hypothetical protein
VTPEGSRHVSFVEGRRPSRWPNSAPSDRRFQPRHSPGSLPPAARLVPPRKPLLERTLAPGGRLTGEEVHDAPVFVDGRPMNALTAGDQPPGLPLLRRGVEQAGVPCDRRCDASAIGHVYGQRVLADLKVRGPRRWSFSRESTLFRPPCGGMAPFLFPGTQTSFGAEKSRK